MEWSESRVSMLTPWEINACKTINSCYIRNTHRSNSVLRLKKVDSNCTKKRVYNVLLKEAHLNYWQVAFFRSGHQVCILITVACINCSAPIKECLFDKGGKPFQGACFFFSRIRFENRKPVKKVLNVRRASFINLLRLRTAVITCASHKHDSTTRSKSCSETVNTTLQWINQN